MRNLPQYIISNGQPVYKPVMMPCLLHSNHPKIGPFFGQNGQKTGIVIGGLGLQHIAYLGAQICLLTMPTHQ